MAFKQNQFLAEATHSAYHCYYYYTTANYSRTGLLYKLTQHQNKNNFSKHILLVYIFLLQHDIR